MSSRLSLIPAALALAGAMAPPAGAAGELFPYPVHRRVLDNGLQVVVIPYDSPGTVAYFTVVRTGSREEVEAGHSGFAHFFEHMMFRGTPRYSQDAYNDVLKRMGADSNASTSDDRTQYYIIGPSAELETMMDLESDRFLNLSYGQEVFRREALAILGEYNKNASSPFLPMFERLRELAFTRHTYGHTTLGYLADIKAMPDYYDYSLSFFERFYRPENCILLVVGDAEPERVFELAATYYGPWQRGYVEPEIPAEPPQLQAHEAHIDWSGPISPHLMMGYRAPAFSDATVDTAALDLISQLLFAESAPLHRKLVVDERWVDTVSGSYSDRRDPYLFLIFSRIKSDELVDEVLTAIEEHITGLQQDLVDGERLERIKSHLRYRFALGLDSPGAIAFTMASFLAVTGDPATVNRLYERYAEVTPEDIRRVAREIFRPQHRTKITLGYAASAAAGEAVEGARP